jgi:hypothetical protein
MTLTRVVTITLSFLLVFFASSLESRALTPSSDDFIFAKDFYQTYMNMERSDKKLVSRLSKVDLQSLSGMKTFMAEKYQYTKESYTVLMGLKPTPQFQDCHQKLLHATYEHLKYLQEGMKIIQQSENTTSIKQHTTKYGAIKQKYTEAMNEFLGIIKQWPEEYIKQVLQS